MKSTETKEYVDLMIKYLNRRQMITVLWWDLFQSKKINQMITHMKNGMSAKFAYKKVKINEN
jgi:hypothetical protein